jgi:hypothetical protein
MDQSEQNGRRLCVPWNKGKLVGQKSPLRLKEIWAIRIRLQLADRLRELALFNLAVDSKLRSCLPKPPPLVSTLVNASVRPDRSPLGARGRIEPSRVRHTYSAPHQSDADLSPDEEPLGRVTVAHSKLESTVRYLGIEVDDALEMAEQTEV